ncbi:Phosphatidylinositol:ceramide inositolphosphotransferase 2 [Camellia lanceoleosa]|uniref:Phosphatidylinositol:ceramide inositolphosphotransferase 2 n=1 Tax=Camellia lanceoleosa TaxID=1840588 RepID=A0ACC0F315_9ERIC|nr:Phosphatidylinositol:ceramide inositolphosphotransferase 2 [Camellia lanceoleosa]
MAPVAVSRTEATGVIRETGVSCELGASGAMAETASTSSSRILDVIHDGWTKEENHNLLNGNSGDPIDQRLRTQVNGKILEDGNTVHVDAVMNGV